MCKQFMEMISEDANWEDISEDDNEVKVAYLYPVTLSVQRCCAEPA